MAGIASAIAAGAAVASAGVGIAGAAGAFGGSLASMGFSPDQIAAIEQAQVNMTLAAAPEQAILNAAAAAGLKAIAPGYTAQTVYNDPRVKSQQDAVTRLQQQLAGTPKAIPNPGQKGANMLNPQWSAIQNQLNTAQQSLTTAVSAIPDIQAPTKLYYDSQGNQVTPAQAQVDFSGYSQGDVNNANNLTQAKGQLALEQQFGPQLISEQLALQKLANPEGVAAREKENQLIQDQIAHPPDLTMANTMRDQLQTGLDAGTKLDPVTLQQVTQEARQAEAARGNLFGEAPAFGEAMTAGQAGINLQNQRQQKALAFLTSGATPTDINYRFGQQNIGNLASFLSGQTPQAQFGQLSGSGAGLAPPPQTTYGATPLNPNSTASTAANQADNLAGLAYSGARNTPNPWLAGLSSILGGVNNLSANNNAGFNAIGNLFSRLNPFSSPTGSPAPISSPGSTAGGPPANAPPGTD
jgi:hypothetical protein